ncbi:MAG: hypothetical protein JWN01_1225 [Patescibacteria group bacterium]|nr:hypothetical protein [Patescibacteria group bacterium]
MTTQSSDADHSKRFPIVGRDQRVDLTKYAVQVHGRDIIDYEKLRADDPALYNEIVAGEIEADRKNQEELDEILSTPAMELTPVLLKSLQSVVATQKPATSKYFYLPLFLSGPRQAQVDEEHKADILTFLDNSGEPMNYASRVLPGQTLAEAIKNDLLTDFAYDGAFQIKNHHFHDTAPDKKGNQLPRLVVIIKVDRFPTTALHPAGLQVQWSSDAATRLSAYRFEL